MTQSGQGEEPSARVPREGIVLPSDGSAPLLPGEQQAAPASGRSWDEPWGPDQSAAPAPPPAQPWSAPGQQQAGAPAAEWGDQSWGAPPQQPHQQPQQPYSQPQQQPYSQPQQQSYSQPRQQSYSQPRQPHQPYAQAPQPQPQHQQPYAQAPQPQAQPQPQPYPQDGALPPEGAQQPSYGAPAYPGPGPEAAGALPPQAGVLDRQSGNPLPPQDGLPPAAAQGGAPLPLAGPTGPADEGATQYIPPVAAHPGDEAATQYIPPVGPGALPPEVSGTSQASSEETQYLGHLSRPGPGPMPAAAPGNPDAEATQYIAPVPPQPYGTGAGPGGAGPRPESDVFDSLFRSEPGGEGAGATQQMPRFQPPQGGQPPQAPYGGAGRAADRHDGGGRSRTGSRVPLIAAVGVGIAVLGIGAGALLSLGGGDDKQNADNKPVAAASDAAESPSASADPAKEQAVALDKLLADSGDSRSAVINAVADIRRCDNLAKAATDLRAAAKQRGDLVTRLSQLSVDKLPDNAALTTALTNAWKASASADNHYAAWADQTGKKKGCRKGQARSTPQTLAGNRASGTASTEKNKAAKLWNSIASTYGLTQRQPTQL
ncbi:hypothetical protein [Streptomyces spongiae]|uniref:Uncharacterized protein n=1 Tax=Streptomyces spongiae TaxID=565072 RepID=A0A5N8XQR6_9ACTN|nr:hypothetical protein [Streptomyces spongiae]MPY61526.1 hypothetical protein [Streptomyces spongiae]